MEQGRFTMVYSVNTSTISKVFMRASQKKAFVFRHEKYFEHKHLSEGIVISYFTLCQLLLSFRSTDGYARQLLLYKYV